MMGDKASPMLLLLMSALVYNLAIAQEARQEVIALTKTSFDAHIASNKYTMIDFYAPWCGHCKKLEPEFDRAAVRIKDRGVKLAKVDAIVEKDLATKYGVKGYPQLLWFEDGQRVDYDGARTADAIFDWIVSMISAPVTETDNAPEPSDLQPRVVLRAQTLLPAFENAAKALRRKARWYFVKTPSGQKIEVQHKGEEPLELAGLSDKDKIIAFVNDNLLPLFGRLDADTFDRYMETKKGLVWSLFPQQNEQDFESVELAQKPLMTQVAKQLKGRYYVTITDTVKFKEAVDSMLSIDKFPAIAVQKTAGNKHKYVYSGEMTAEKILAFIRDVDANRITPRFKSQPVPTSPTQDSVQIVVGSTLKSSLFLPDRDVLLEVYAPWCGHCKKLEPEYVKLAKKIDKEGLSDLLVIAKMDGTVNDSPIDSIDWTGFPTIFFAKAGSGEATLYDGERTAKSLWKYIKKHSTKADEIRERIERR